MAIKENLETIAVKSILGYVTKDPEKNFPRLVEWFDRFDRKGTLKAQRDTIREIVNDKDNNWYRLIMSCCKDIDPGVRDRLFENFIINGSLLGYQKQVENMEEYRKTKPLFTVDFWNDGEYVGGCVAGGRRYLHINANGDIEPCAFVHYSDSNIREKTLLDAYRSSLFMGYHDNQPWNENLLRSCPVLDNPGRLTEIVEKAGAKSTDYQNLESAKEFSDKCVEKAEKWAPVAERLWRESGKGATEDPEEKANQVNHYCGTCRKCAGQSR